MGVLDGGPWHTWGQYGLVCLARFDTLEDERYGPTIWSWSSSTTFCVRKGIRQVKICSTSWHVSMICLQWFGHVGETRLPPDTGNNGDKTSVVVVVVCARFPRRLIKCKNALKLNKYKNLPINSLNVCWVYCPIETEKVLWLWFRRLYVIVFIH